MTPDFTRLYPRLPPEHMAWADYVCSFLTEGLDDLQAAREGTSLRIRRGEHRIAMGPRRNYLSIYFRHPSFAES